MPIRRHPAAASRAARTFTPTLLALSLLTACFDDSTSPRTNANPSSSNKAPVISGAPVSSASVGVPWVFVPKASDPEQQRLVFKISGKPSWMSFSASSGQLYGLPGAAQVGRHDGIQIRVSDGVNEVALPAFSIVVAASTTLGSARLRWVAPTRTTSGRPLSGLAGYRVYYGTTEPKFERMLEIRDATATQAVIANLGPGTWYFSIAAYTRDGVESARSNAVLKSI